MRKIWHFSGKIDQHLSLFCGSVKTKLPWEITGGTRISVLERVSWDVSSKIYWQFWHCSFKNTLESSYNFCPIEITWRKLLRSVCLTPLSRATWRFAYIMTFRCTSVQNKGSVCNIKLKFIQKKLEYSTACVPHIVLQVPIQAVEGQY